STVIDWQLSQGTPQAAGPTANPALGSNDVANGWGRVVLGTLTLSTSAMSAGQTSKWYIEFLPNTFGSAPGTAGATPFGGDTVSVGSGATQADLDQSNINGTGGPWGGESYTGAVPTFFTITMSSPVPEPGSLFLLGGVVAAGAGRWWLKRRKAAVATS